MFYRFLNQFRMSIMLSCLDLVNRICEFQWDVSDYSSKKDPIEKKKGETTMKAKLNGSF